VLPSSASKKGEEEGTIAVKASAKARKKRRREWREGGNESAARPEKSKADMFDFKCAFAFDFRKYPLIMLGVNQTFD